MIREGRRIGGDRRNWEERERLLRKFRSRVLDERFTLEDVQQELSITRSVASRLLHEIQGPGLNF
jgi:hypothetical protein